MFELQTVLTGIIAGLIWIYSIALFILYVQYIAAGRQIELRAEKIFLFIECPTIIQLH